MFAVDKKEVVRIHASSGTTGKSKVVGYTRKDLNNWIEIGHVGPEESGFPRNHNPAILTDTKGYMLNEDELVMYFTPAMTGENWLWSYDLYSATFSLKDYFE